MNSIQRNGLYFVSPDGILARFALALLVLVGATTVRSAEFPSIEDKVGSAQRMEGYFDLFWDASSGSLYWEIDKLDTEFLYQVSMGSGLGSNPVGIDRGQLRGTYVLAARR